MRTFLCKYEIWSRQQRVTENSEAFHSLKKTFIKTFLKALVFDNCSRVGIEI